MGVPCAYVLLTEDDHNRSCSTGPSNKSSESTERASFISPISEVWLRRAFRGKGAKNSSQAFEHDRQSLVTFAKRFANCEGTPQEKCPITPSTGQAVGVRNPSFTTVSLAILLHERPQGKRMPNPREVHEWHHFYLSIVELHIEERHGTRQH